MHVVASRLLECADWSSVVAVFDGPIVWVCCVLVHIACDLLPGTVYSIPRLSGVLRSFECVLHASICLLVLRSILELERPLLGISCPPVIVVLVLLHAWVELLEFCPISNV